MHALNSSRLQDASIAFMRSTPQGRYFSYMSIPQNLTWVRGVHSMITMKFLTRDSVCVVIIDISPAITKDKKFRHSHGVMVSQNNIEL
jgi:hypothetical protein